MASPLYFVEKELKEKKRRKNERRESFGFILQNIIFWIDTL